MLEMEVFDPLEVMSEVHREARLLSPAHRFELNPAQNARISADKGMIKGRVSAGHPVIAIMGPGDFTTTGHFIVICGIDENGRAIIRDPNSAERTNKPWDLDKLIAQARNFWAYSV